jgi:hypothetical protein
MSWFHILSRILLIELWRTLAARRLMDKLIAAGNLTGGDCINL